jgi:hypothetical protein
MVRSDLTDSSPGLDAPGFATIFQRTRLLGLVAAVAVAPPLSGCGSGTSPLSTATIQHAIVRSVLAQRHLHVSVSCPPTVPRRAGFVFACVARLDVGMYPIMVTEISDSGHVRYQNQAPLVILDIAGIERAIGRSIYNQRHLRSTVTCPAEVIQEAGVRFTCTALVRDRRYPFQVTEIDSSGHVRYEGR